MKVSTIAIATTIWGFILLSFASSMDISSENSNGPQILGEGGENVLRINDEEAGPAPGDFVCPEIGVARFDASKVTGSCKRLNAECISKHIHSKAILEGFKSLKCDDANIDIVHLDKEHIGSLTVLVMNLAFSPEKGKHLLERAICDTEGMGLKDEYEQNFVFVAFAIFENPFVDETFICLKAAMERLLKREYCPVFLIRDRLLKPFLSIPILDQMYSDVFYKIATKMKVWSQSYEMTADDVFAKIKGKLSGPFKTPIRNERDPNDNRIYSKNSFHDGFLSKDIEVNNKQKSYMHVCQGFRQYFAKDVFPNPNGDGHSEQVNGEEDDAHKLKRKLIEYCDNLVENGSPSEIPWNFIFGAIVVLLIFFAIFIFKSKSKSNLRSKAMRAGANATREKEKV